MAKKSSAKSLTVAQRVNELEKAVSILLLRSDELVLTKKIPDLAEGSLEHAKAVAELADVRAQLAELA